MLFHDSEWAAIRKHPLHGVAGPAAELLELATSSEEFFEEAEAFLFLNFIGNEASRAVLCRCENKDVGLKLFELLLNLTPAPRFDLKAFFRLCSERHSTDNEAVVQDTDEATDRADNKNGKDNQDKDDNTNKAIEHTSHITDVEIWAGFVHLIDCIERHNEIGTEKAYKDYFCKDQRETVWHPQMYSISLPRPAGIVLRAYNDLLQLLSVREAATRHHQWLYKNGIIHHNISPDTIVITEPNEENNHSRGMLILRRSASNARRWRFAFMARDILRGEEHRCYHDWNLFFTSSSGYPLDTPGREDMYFFLERESRLRRISAGNGEQARRRKSRRIKLDS